MPNRERVLDFIARMQQGQSLELMPELYAEDATAQENGAAPRVGLATLVEHERQTLARMGAPRAAPRRDRVPVVARRQDRVGALRLCGS